MEYILPVCAYLAVGLIMVGLPNPKTLKDVAWPFVLVWPVILFIVIGASLGKSDE